MKVIKRVPWGPPCTGPRRESKSQAEVWKEDIANRGQKQLETVQRAKY